MAQVTVSITFDTTTKTFSYSDPNQRVDSYVDTLQFTCNKNYAIQFANNQSPYDVNTPKHKGKAKKATGYLLVKDTNGTDVPHKYTVAVYYKGDIYTDDPQIIVEDSGGGGGVQRGAQLPKARKKKASKKSKKK